MALAFMKKAFKPFKMFPLRSKAVHGSIQGQNLAWTVVWVPNSVAQVGGSCFDSEGVRAWITGFDERRVEESPS